MRRTQAVFSGLALPPFPSPAVPASAPGIPRILTLRDVPPTSADAGVELNRYQNIPLASFGDRAPDRRRIPIPGDKTSRP